MTQSNFETAFERVGKLVADFRQHEKAYTAPAYSESDVRKDFIDKFWIALGWDVNHEQQTNPYEQDVKVERNVEVKGRKKKADYAFLAPNFRDVRFFVEAKKPARNIDNADDYFQTIRYGWNAQAALCVLTDFEQFRILDCRYKPDVQTALHRAVQKFHYTDYADADRFREIYYLFSREAAINGALEKYAATLPKPKGKAAHRKVSGGSYKSVDEDFLQELDDLREELARAFKNRNAHLNGEELTEATQRTIDRLVFMRFLEDKLIEPDAIVAKFGERGGAAWADFVSESARLDRIYNGIIFKRHAIIDSPDFVVDEKSFAGVRGRLAHTDSPYDFNSLPVHILGSIYERFLGKVITTTDKRAKVEEKPEVRKAGGVYYTPAYIVRYIVEHTVGRLIAGKSPEQIAEMRFADIACGSGSFLLGVYDELLRYHTAYYNEPENRRKAVKNGCIENPDGTLRLSLKQRKRILLNNIYGVDLDAQAVEVAQLSLFLKLLEDETTASAKGHQLEFRETMLPSLDRNVIHGNSLIGWDILDGQLFEGDEERKLYPLDFAQAFPEVMRRGGFDAIVGNPPWGAEFSGNAKRYLVKHYSKVPTKTKDSYFYFIYRALEALKENGLLGFIIPNTWLLINNAKDVRRDILSLDLKEIIDHGDGIFKQATVESSTIILSNSEGGNNCRAVRYRKGVLAIDHLVSKDLWRDDELCRIVLDINDDSFRLLKKIRQISVPFEKECQIIWGIKPYQVGYGEPPQTQEVLGKRVFHATTKLGDEWKPLVVGSNVNRYSLAFSENLFIKYGRWLMYPSNETLMLKPKILLRQTSDILRACYDDQKYYCQNSVFIVHSETIELKYLLGLMNSKLMGFVYKFGNPQTAKVFAEIKPSVIKQLPIRTINFSDPADRARDDRMVSLVEAMLAAKRQLQGARTDSDCRFYENKCAALDRQIDALVYELYELTPAEIALAEG